VNTYKTPAKDLFVFLEVFACEGGIQSYVRDIFRAYRALADHPSHPLRQAEVLLLRDRPRCENPFEAKTDRPPVFKFNYLKTKPLWLGRVRFVLALLIQVLYRRPDRVFCGHINLAPLIRTVCRPLKIPYTVLTYGKEVWMPLPRAYRQALQEADRIWTISRYSRDLACQANHLHPQQFDILPCTIDGTVFSPGEKPPKLLDRYGLGDDRVLMTVARLWSGDIYKGVDVTLRALPKIAQVFPDVKYLIIGRGDDQPRLARLAEELGVADRAIFAGFVPTEELPDHYRVADAYIMPSQEGFGIVYLEAMATGIPVLSGDSDGSADPLQDGKMGWQVPHRDPEAVAAACIEILKGGDRRCDGVWLRQQTLEVFSIEAFAEQLQELLQG
jgi:phosphatidyl-myo-inositol dimannoside synthase